MVKYDHHLKPVEISKPFKLTDDNIEFITYMAVDGENIVIGDTLMDERPEILTFDRDTIENAIW